MGLRETVLIEWLGITLERNIQLPNTFRFKASVRPRRRRASSQVFERRIAEQLPFTIPVPLIRQILFNEAIQLDPQKDFFDFTIQMEGVGPGVMFNATGQGRAGPLTSTFRVPLLFAKKRVGEFFFRITIS